MLLYESNGEVGCDRCKEGIASSETAAELAGWLVDVGVQPHKHFCPECRRHWEGPVVRRDA